jgi:chromosome segregation ATPase
LLQSKKEDFEDKVDEQEGTVERLQKEDGDLQNKKKEIMAGEEAAKAAVKKHQDSIAAACNSTNEIITMFQEELSKSVRESTEINEESNRLQSQWVDESSVFDMMKQHVRYLEQYRVDSIFRIFALKAQVKVLGDKLNK